MNTKQKNCFILLLLFSITLLETSFTAFAQSKHEVKEVALDSQLPGEGFSDLIIQSQIKKNMSWKLKTYFFTFKLEREKYVKEVKGTVEEKSDITNGTVQGVYFSTTVRFRLSVGKHTILFDSPEKFRPVVVSVVVMRGKLNSLEFRPVYAYSKKEKTFRDSLSEFEAIFNGERIPIRYERFNIH